MPATATKTPITIPAIAPDDSPPPPPPPTMTKTQETTDRHHVQHRILTIGHFNVSKI